MNASLLKSARSAVWLGALAACACTKFASELDSPGGAPAPGSEVGGTAPLANWSCMTEARAPRAGVAADTARPLTYSMQVVDLVSEQPVVGVQARACFRADVQCANPVTATFSGSSDGLIAVTVYQGFDGYLEITGPGVIPTLLFFPDAWSAELITALEQLPMTLLPASALVGLAQSARVQLDPDSGILAMSTYDCDGPGAAGVRFEIDTPGVPYVFVDRLPVAYREVTSADGNAGFVNVPPGIVAVSAFPDAEVDLASVDTLLIRTGWVTSTRLLPRFAR
jgi:hypothetical protein